MSPWPRLAQAQGSKLDWHHGWKGFETLLQVGGQAPTPERPGDNLWPPLPYTVLKRLNAYIIYLSNFSLWFTPMLAIWTKVNRNSFEITLGQSNISFPSCFFVLSAFLPIFYFFLPCLLSLFLPFCLILSLLSLFPHLISFFPLSVPFEAAVKEWCFWGFPKSLQDGLWHRSVQSQQLHCSETGWCMMVHGPPASKIVVVLPFIGCVAKDWILWVGEAAKGWCLSLLKKSTDLFFPEIICPEKTLSILQYDHSKTGWREWCGAFASVIRGPALL